nr:LPXTG cell wall anchor domain-containing protein [Staphylococcus kloosii]
MTKQKSTNSKKLPNTGANDSINAPILGATLSLLGTLTLVSRRKKQQD